MVAVRNQRVSTIVVDTFASGGRTGGGVGGADFNDMFIVMIAVQGVKMAVMQVIRMVAVLDGEMTAIGAVRVFGMRCMIHDFSPSVTGTVIGGGYVPCLRRQPAPCGLTQGTIANPIRAGHL
jgi:hypothetical protein